MADKRIDQLVAATTLGNNDLLVLEQNNQAKKMSGATLASFVYNAATDKIAEVNQAVADAQDAVDSLEEQKNTIAEAIASMADLGTDTTLSTTGMAADAKATGDRINDAETAALAGLDQGSISGVAVASFDDGADNTPVKALKIAIEPKQDLHGYANPWPAGGGKNLMPLNFTTGTFNGITISLVSNGGIQFSGTANADVIRQEVLDEPLPAGTYTFSLNNSAAVGSGSCRFICLSEDNASLLDLYLTSANVKRTFTTEVPIAKLRFQIGNESTVNNVVYPQLEVGSTATAFAPYSNICPITGWTEANVMRTGKNIADCSGIVNLTGWSKSGDVYSGNSSYLNQFIIPIKDGSKQIAFSCDYYGDTANRAGYWRIEYTDNTITYIECIGTSWTHVTGVSNANKTISRVMFGMSNSVNIHIKNLQVEYGSSATDYEPFGKTYEISFPAEAGTVYGGTLDVTKGKLTVDWAMKTFDGSETNWIEHPGYETTAGYYQNAFGPSELPSEYFSPSTRVCNILKSVSNITNTLATKSGEFSFSSANYGRNLYFTYPQNVSSITDMKALVTETPMQVCYKLASPVLYDLTPTEVTTLLALNNIWADTGNILDLIYRKEPITEGEIQEQIDIIRSAIATAEDSGVASTNYSIGALILVGSNLVEVTSPIAQGESIVIGSNCQETTVAAQIAYLKSIVNGIGNLAYLSYENA